MSDWHMSTKVPVDTMMDFANNSTRRFPDSGRSFIRCYVLQVGIPISKSYLLTYPDGSKKHIGTAERDDLCLSGLVRELSPRKYLFTGQQHTFHSFSELASLAQSFSPTKMRRFLPGSFIFEHKGKRQRELLETPGAYAYRLNLYQRAEA